MISDIASITPQAANEDTSTDNAPGYQELPHNFEAEQGLLGMLLVDNNHLERINDLLRPEHFSHPTHQRIYATIEKMIERGLEAKPTTLKDYFEKDESLEAVGGTGYLVELATEVPMLNSAMDYAQTIYDRHLRREIIRMNTDTSRDAYNYDIDKNAPDIIEEAESKLFKLSEDGATQGGFVTLRDSVLVAIDSAEKAFHADGHVTGVTTGLTDLDAKLGGFHNSDLLILAGRPSMGKTALAVNIGFNAAKAYAESGGEQGAVVGFFSLEMSSDQLAGRILADQADISGDDLRKGNLQQDDFRRFVEASQKLSQVPFYIDDTPALSIGAVRTRARRLKRQHGLGMLIIDYLQLLRGSGSKQSTENRVNEISEITRGLKAIAKELQIPVLALSQLSRAVEQREDKRPMLSDLRESGSIEQDADVVQFVYRREYYLSREEPQKNPGEDDGKFNDRYADWQRDLAECASKAECIVVKQRHGPIGSVPLYFDSSRTRFSDLEERYD
ncbi:MAG: replicative DNA helicase [Alphaproteobacteria bacterium]|nr:replicative DNA helicase [Alphaproteobacteria bacterium]